MGKPDIVIQAAESQIGSPYVYGTWGQECTVALRKRYASYSPSQAETTYKRCPVLSDKQTTCAGCKYQGRLAFDCRGFTHWALNQAGIEITGGYVGRQWSDSNWAEKGDIGAMPDLVCCVFIRKSNGNWSHTGLHVGGGRIIHCSVDVKTDDLNNNERAWTHYAIPNGLYTAEEIAAAHERRGLFVRTLKKGYQGEDVRAMQEMLNRIGYNCGTADGIFGTKTLEAVRRFQENNGLSVDGIAGPETLTLLAARAADPTTPELPDDGEAPNVYDGYVLMDYETAITVRKQLKNALEIIENAIGDAKP